MSGACHEKQGAEKNKRQLPIARFHRAGGQTAPLRRKEHAGNKQYRCKSLTSLPMKKWLGVSVQGRIRSGCWHPT